MKIASRIAMVLALGASAPSASADDGDLKPRLNGEIRGRVVEVRTQRPLHYANVSIIGTRLRTMTQEDGTFRIAEVPPGVYSVKVNMMAYRSIEGRGVRVGLGRTTTIPVDLALEINYCCQKKGVVVVELDDDVRLARLLSGTLEPRLQVKEEYFAEEFAYEGTFARRGIVPNNPFARLYPRVRKPWSERRESHAIDARLERAAVTWTEVWKTRSGLR